MTAALETPGFDTPSTTIRTPKSLDLFDGIVLAVAATIAVIAIAARL
ncbi:MAG: hypothetical protein AAFR88_04580 [Pseudomonadota bacterium]